MEEVKEQKLLLNDRKSLELEGVIDVNNFTEEIILLETNLGSLVVIGEELHINHLDLENTELKVDGHIKELKYDQEDKTTGFIKRLFK